MRSASRLGLAALALLAAAAAGGAGAAGLPPVRALLTHETSELRADGVTRTTRYQERFLRRGRNIWVERVLAPAESKPANAHGGHEDFNIYLAPRWVRAGQDGAAVLTLVDDAHAALYAVARPEYAMTGFSGRWAAEGSLIDPATLKTLHPVASKSNIAGTRWYEDDGAREYTRVLWDEALKFPLQIETGTRDGRNHNRTLVQLLPVAAAEAPWQRVQNYLMRELDDLGD